MAAIQPAMSARLTTVVTPVGAFTSAYTNRKSMNVRARNVSSATPERATAVFHPDRDNGMGSPASSVVKKLHAIPTLVKGAVSDPCDAPPPDPPAGRYRRSLSSGAGRWRRASGGRRAAPPQGGDQGAAFGAQMLLGAESGRPPPGPTGHRLESGCRSRASRESITRAGPRLPSPPAPRPRSGPS